jgi:hypothetical protein
MGDVGQVLTGATAARRANATRLMSGPDGSLLATALRPCKLLIPDAGPVTLATGPVFDAHQPVLEPTRLGRIPTG